MQRAATFIFHDAKEYAFLYENAHLLLVTYERDDAKLLFLIRGEAETGALNLGYPGTTFTETVLDAVLPIFFVKVEEQGAEPLHYVLGSYFLVGGQRFGAYYERDANERVVLFAIVGDAPDLSLEVPDDHQFQVAAAAFADQHQDLLHVQAGHALHKLADKNSENSRNSSSSSI